MTRNCYDFVNAAVEKWCEGKPSDVAEASMPYVDWPHSPESFFVETVLKNLQ